MIDAIFNESALDEQLMAPSERDVAAASQLEGNVIILRVRHVAQDALTADDLHQ